MLLGDTDTLKYSYDLSGRLEHVFRNDTLISTYTYDNNGNRLSHTTPSGTNIGIYDAQDRMLSYVLLTKFSSYFFPNYLS